MKSLKTTPQVRESQVEVNKGWGESSGVEATVPKVETFKEMRVWGDSEAVASVSLNREDGF
jgi:hypothetical protein